MSIIYDAFEIPIYLNVEPLDEYKCMHCNKDYQHRKAYRKCEYTGLKEVEFITFCSPCRKLFRKKHKIMNQFLEIDWKLFQSKY